MCVRYFYALFILAVSASLATAQSGQQCPTGFRQLSNGSLCIHSDFTRTLSDIVSELQCSFECTKEPRCQAFTTQDGPCQLFVFDKCSKSVRSCSCSRRGRVFVKRQPGLEPGALCPSGYGDELCGVKYRLVNDFAVWQTQRQRCESEPGLVIMADVMNMTEMTHIDQIYDKYNPGSFYLGGFQPAGSSENAGGWQWISCNISMVAGLWSTGEPNGGVSEDVTARHQTIRGVVDISKSDTLPALCECVSPFN